MFLPFNLSALHYYPVKTNGLLPVEYYIATVIILLIIFLILKINKTNKLKKDLIFGLMFFLITISLVLQIIPVGRAITAERYTYIPYIGLFFIIGQYFTLINSKKNSRKAIKTKSYLYIVLIVYIIFFSYTTYNRNKVWKNGITLFSDVIKKYPSRSFAYWACAIAKAKAYNTYEAIDDYDKAIKLKPDYINAYVDRGNAKSDLKKYKQAINDYNKAIELDSNYLSAYLNRGVAKGILKNYKGAINDFNKIIKTDADNADAYYNLGISKLQINMKKQACEDLKKADELGSAHAAEIIKKYCNYVKN